MSSTRFSQRHRKSRKTAMRIAVFLDSIGIEPVSVGRNWTEVLRALITQYESLPAEIRKEARRQGRTLIRERGFRAVAKAVIAGPAPTSPKPKVRKTARHRLPKCDRCRTVWTYKSIWDSKEAAEQFCAESKDAGLNVYKCPHANGFHVGHLRADTSTGESLR